MSFLDMCVVYKIEGTFADYRFLCIINLCCFAQGFGGEFEM